MLKKIIKYKDFDGNQREETFYFHIPTTKLFEMEITTPGGFKAMVEQLIQEQDVEKVLEIFKGFIKASYGIKSPDGKRHMQSEEIWQDFVTTNAYTKLYMELVLNAEAGAGFVNGIVDQEQIDEVYNGTKVPTMGEGEGELHQLKTEG